MDQLQSSWLVVMSIPSVNEKHLQLCLERDRALCSPEFARSPVMSKLLKFLIAHKLADDGTILKAYTIAVDGLERTEDFDPQSDSYPRVQIGRLRKMLEAFYAIEGGTTRLQIPIGSYEIAIVDNQGGQQSVVIETEAEQSLGTTEDQQPNSPTKTTLKFNTRAIAVFVAFVGMISAASFFTMGIFVKTDLDVIDYPSLAIEEPTFVSIERDAATANQMMNIINEALFRFEGLNIYYSDSDIENQTDYKLITNVISGHETEANFRLVNRNNSKIIWSKTLKGELHTAEMDLRLAKTLVEIAGPYGAVAEDRRIALNGSLEAGYPCMLQFDNYMRYRKEKKLRPILDCLEKTLEKNPSDAFVMSNLAYASYIARQRKIKVANGRSGPVLAREAVEIDPRSASAKFALARSEFFSGHCNAGKKWGYEAVEQNPLDTRILGYFSIYLSVCRDQNAEAMATRALELDGGIDLIIPANLTMIKLARNDRQGAYEISQRYLNGASRNEPSLLVAGAIAAAAFGRPKEAKALWRKVTIIFNMPSNSNARPVLEKFIVNKQLLDRMEYSLQATNLTS
jgi:tetratricopeptide (TPR) repeat protein